MSLVVGEIHDGRISLVADTKVTHAGDDRSTRHVFENAFPKLLILRDDLCVGLAGNDPEGVAESLLAVRSEPVEQVLSIAEALVHASFGGASLVPLRPLLDTTEYEAYVIDCARRQHDHEPNSPAPSARHIWAAGSGVAASARETSLESDLRR